MAKKRKSKKSNISNDDVTSELIRMEVEGDQVWDDRERVIVQQAALDVGNAIARDIQRLAERSRRLQTAINGSSEDTPSPIPMSATDAFLKTYGRPVRFMRKKDPSGGSWWGETKSRDLVFVFRNAPHSFPGDTPAAVGNRPEFSVHELGHVFENVIASAIGTKKGRNSIPSSLLNRTGGFFQRSRFQQSQDKTPGEIFADMFIGWVYDRWATADGLPESPLKDAGLARKRFMDSIMIDLIEIAISHNNP
jgi:hypothetical protein